MRKLSVAGPAAASRYLLPDEQQVFATRRHPAVLFLSGAEALGGLLAALILNGTLANSMALKLVIWIPAAFLIAQSLWTVGKWRTLWLVVTSQRLLLVQTLGTRSVAMTPLSDLTRMRLERSPSGRLFGFGMFVDGSSRRIIFNYVPYTEQLYLEICVMLFPSDVVDLWASDGDD
jgi:type IV secretory pathway TrbD component